LNIWLHWVILPCATKDNHINNHKNDWFEHKSQMNGLEWIGFPVFTAHICFCGVLFWLLTLVVKAPTYITSMLKLLIVCMWSFFFKSHIRLWNHLVEFFSLSHLVVLFGKKIFCELSFAKTHCLGFYLSVFIG